MDTHLGLLLILGIGAFGGVLGAWLFQRMKIPQVVGYIVIGLIIGQSGLQLVKAHDIEMLRNFNYFALGIIGFLVGGELHGSTFRKYGKTFAAILLGEGLAAFVLVGVPSGLMVYSYLHNVPESAAAGIVFGAIASATDPASTIDVLWEYRARGVLTTALIAIVALDDALAMTLYGLGTSAAQMLAGGNADIMVEIKKVCIELLGAVAVGAIAGFILNFILRRLHDSQKTLGISIGSVLLVIGISLAADMDVILAAMTLGLTLTNLAPRRSQELFNTVRSFSTPVYVLFFVLVGARLGLGDMPSWLWWLVGIYVLGRSVGKFVGSFLGAKISGAERSVQLYGGLGLFAQGGVAVGLSIMASQHLQGINIGDLPMGDMIIFTVTATTLIVQLIGPPMTKLAIKLADEIGRDIKSEDVIAEWKVSDVMDTEFTSFDEHTPLSKVVQVFSEGDRVLYPVLDSDKKLLGQIGYDAVREMLGNQDTWDWLVAGDVLRPVQEEIPASMPLKDALNLMRETGIEQMVVVDKNTSAPVGIIEQQMVRKRVGREVLSRQRVGGGAEGSVQPA